VPRTQKEVAVGSLLMRCCADDEGVVALRRRPAGGDAKSPQAALVSDCCGVVNMNVGGESSAMVSC
jgi:hypothetical protein